MSLSFSYSGGDTSIVWSVSWSFFYVINAVHSDNNSDTVLVLSPSQTHLNPPLGSWSEMILSGAHENMFMPTIEDHSV